MKVALEYAILRRTPSRQLGVLDSKSNPHYIVLLDAQNKVIVAPRSEYNLVYNIADIHSECLALIVLTCNLNCRCAVVL